MQHWLWVGSHNWSHRHNFPEGNESIFVVLFMLFCFDFVNYESTPSFFQINGSFIFEKSSIADFIYLHKLSCWEMGDIATRNIGVLNLLVLILHPCMIFLFYYLFVFIYLLFLLSFCMTFIYFIHFNSVILFWFQSSFGEKI